MATEITDVAAPNQSDAAAAERRAAQRYPLGGSAQITTALWGSATDVVLLTISAGGVSFTTQKSVDAGKRCHLRMSLFTPSGREFPVDTEIQIRYCIQEGIRKFRIGAKFLDLNPADLKKIAAIIELRRAATKAVPAA